MEEPEPMQSINPQQLEYALVQIAIGFQDIMNSPDTPDGRTQADLKKRVALTTLSNNFNLGCGMLASVHSDDRRTIHPNDKVNEIANNTGSTINRWYDEKVAMTGYSLLTINNNCKKHIRGGKKKRSYRQKGGAMPDRYDVFTMILLGSSAALAVGRLATNQNNFSILAQASNYVVDSVIGFAIKMGTFKEQCDSASATSWNLFQRYTIGNLIPVETCLQKIQYNEAQITLIKAALSGLAITLGGVTSYVSAEHAGNSVKAIYSAVKQNISIPVVDMIMRRVSQSGEELCSLGARGRDAAMSAFSRRASLRSAASTTQTLQLSQLEEVQQAAEAQAQSQQEAILNVNEQIKQLVSSGGALSPEDFNRIIEQLRNPEQRAASPTALPAEGPDAMEVEGGRRRKRATRKSKMGKKSKTMKRKSKGKFKSKARKGKKSRNMRRRTHRAKK